MHTVPHKSASPRWGLAGLRYGVRHTAALLPGTAVFDRLRADPRVWQFAFHSARDVPEMLVAGPWSSIRRLDLLRSSEHCEGRHLDEQERAARLQEPRHPGQCLVVVEHVVQRS